MNLGIQNKVVIITGGSTGLGKAVSFLFAEEGADVVLTCKSNMKMGLKTADDLSSLFGIRSMALNCDISSEKSVNNVFNQALDEFGKVDILINNAGYWPSSFVRDMQLEEWRKCIDVNLTGHFIFSKIFTKHLMDNEKKGKVVNIVSFAGFIGSTTGHAHYASAKAGLITFTKSLARETGPFGINVNAVSPGMMHTGMTEKVLAEKEKEYLKRIPLGRIASPEEVANTVVFLSSDRADYITGAVFDVSGGLLMH